MNDITNRADVQLLVTTFYTQIRKHETLGVFFNEMITDWDEHLEKLTDFWESNLFFKAKFKGNPAQAHIQVDQHFQHSIKMEHFGMWLNLWVATIDSLFEGELANRAKANARKMATHLYITLYQARSQH
ncbi:MAG: group III truncated hemoglobin [Flavobacteriaceae bacterium]|nr:group III truncated hemoglobin [Flavobacteriaceae bacterium]